jgi:prepilin signal peptidase PulO-like enzyme (type II secretory pathway)
MVMAATLAIGAASAWHTPALARALPSRQQSDRGTLHRWSRRSRALLGTVGALALTILALTRPSPVLLAMGCVIGPVLLAAAAVDARTERLPDRTLIVVAISVIACAAILSMTGRGAQLGTMLTGAALLGGASGITFIASRGTFGFGDVT